MVNVRPKQAVGTAAGVAARRDEQLKGENKMINIKVDDLWRRIDADGLPPLAKTVFLGTSVIGRIIDDADYKDDFASPAPIPVYLAQVFNGNRWFNAGTFQSFDAALDAITGWW